MSSLVRVTRSGAIKQTPGGGDNRRIAAIRLQRGHLVTSAHGVGPMRAYALGAMLLDLEHPTRVLGGAGRAAAPGHPDDRDGYVPNVVYSCGALKHGDTLVIPHGFGDMGIEFATAPIPELLAVLCS